MKVPAQIRTFCPKCGSHTLHSVSLYKKGKERAMALGHRRYEEERKGYGGQKYPEQKRTAKTTKKQTLMLKCQNCGFELTRDGIRLRKLEIVR